jgi:hypothetical protein
VYRYSCGYMYSRRSSSRSSVFIVLYGHVMAAEICETRAARLAIMIHRVARDVTDAWG